MHTAMTFTNGRVLLDFAGEVQLIRGKGYMDVGITANGISGRGYSHSQPGHRMNFQEAFYHAIWAWARIAFEAATSGGTVFVTHEARWDG